MRAIFHEGAVRAKIQGLEVDKSTITRAIRLEEGQEVEIPDVVYLDEFILNIFLNEMRLMVNSKGKVGLADSTKRQYRNWRNILLEYQEERDTRISLIHATIDDVNKFVAFLIDREYAPATMSSKSKISKP